MLDIRYNSWLEKYKKPFGAVQAKQPVTINLRLVIEQPLLSVELMVHPDRQMTSENYPLHLVAAGIYQATFTPTKAGLYYYYFKIVIQHDDQQAVYFYGAADDGFGGPGRLTTIDNLKSYQLTCYQKPAVSPEWYRNGVFYQIFPDRFYNGNPNGEINARRKNTFIYATPEDTPYYIKNQAGEVVRWDFFGGNLQGIIAKIPYLKKLGITGIYLNPIFFASSSHRYDTNDYLKIDPILGTEADFKELTQQLHQAGMHLILDGVFNHVGKDSKYFNAQQLFYGADQGAAQDPHSPYRDWFDFENYPTDYESWWGVKDLPRVNKNQPAFRQLIYGTENSVIQKWTDLGVDGWRLDVADELPDDFIQKIHQRLQEFSTKKVLLGEVWEDASNKIAYNQRKNYPLGDELDGVMNYPLRHCLLDLLAYRPTRSTAQNAREIMSLQENYPPEFYYNSLNNLGTHDTERIFTAVGEDRARLKLAWDLLFMLPGVPCIYYGDEAGMKGGKDPLNRGFFPWNKIDQTIFAYVHRWIERRKTQTVLQQGNLILGTTAGCLAIIRSTPEQLALYVVNLSAQQQQLDQLDFEFIHDDQDLGEFITTEFADFKLVPSESCFKVIKRV
ncbi:glycoside hydrolase family 13 protein [Liquorilactobacillus nagelii]|uniref:glycoside hydrolase family 13 protein n=2 Tax=Liquorilactobacillus nagelii TaxID=82688 RepID=UPI001CCD30B7|nr:glycoside hydrolase family 13 protein [Liquorilactobacillus nagelii]ULQ48729.1 glycoside hydrolase family 13 protein [Liquorilactobacillus nagelii]